MNDERGEQRYPGVEQVGSALRANLLRAVRAYPEAPSRLSRRRRVGVLAAIGLVTVPGGIALAELFDSPEVEYQCPSAAPPPDVDVRAGVPVDSAGPVVEEPPGTVPVNPCE